MARVLFSAGLAALGGALLWGAFSYYTGYEIGYVALAIGMLIGSAAVAVGGKGKRVGVFCAVLALASIFAGKMMAVQFAAPGQVRKLMDKILTQRMYGDEKKNAADFAALTSEGQYAEFMVSHGLSKAKKAAEVSPTEKSEFINGGKLLLEKFQREQPSYQQWKEEQTALAINAVSSGPVFESLVSNLGAMDIVFVLLGLASAYKIPDQRGEDACPQSF